MCKHLIIDVCTVAAKQNIEVNSVKMPGGTIPEKYCCVNTEMILSLASRNMTVNLPSI